MSDQDDRKLLTPETRTGSGTVVGEPLAEAQSLGRYQILSVAGTGGMGRVYAAFDPKLDRRVALKVVHAPKREVRQQRATREAKALARLSHPNVVAIHEVGEHDGRLLIAMEYVRGVTLKVWMLEHPPSNKPTWMEAALDVLLQAGRGLAAAHQAQLVHRDFKPSNVLVGQDGRVRVVDFGLARGVGDRAVLTSTAEEGVRNSTEGVTETGAIVGTPGYMSPEQLAGATLDGRVDQYAFSVTAWEVLFGERPKDAEAKRPKESAVPDGVEKALRKSLAKTPGGRFRNMESLLKRLETERDVLAGRKRKTPWLRVFGALALAATASASVFVARRLVEEREISACIASEDVSSLWGPDEEEAVRNRVSTSGLGGSDALEANLVRYLRSRAQEWTDAHMTACRVAIAEEQWSEEDTTAVDWCLEERRADFSMVLEVLASEEPAAPLFAVSAAASLPPLEPCLFPESLPPAPPRHVRESPLFEELRHALLRASAHREAGSYKAALAASRDSVALAQGLSWAPSLLVARLSLAGHASEGEDLELAEEQAKQAFRDAIAAADWGSATDAATLVAGGFAFRDESEEARFWSDIAAATLKHASDPLLMRSAAIRQVRCQYLRHQGDYEGSLREGQAGAELLSKTLGPEHPKVHDILLDISRVHRARGQWKKAIALRDSVIDSETRTLGARHPRVAGIIAGKGQDLSFAGDREGARTSLQRAIDILETSLPKDHHQLGTSYAMLAGLHQEGGQWEAAIHAYERALPSYAGAFHGTGKEMVLLGLLGRAYGTVGRKEDGLRMFSNALEIAESEEIELDAEKTVLFWADYGAFLDQHGTLDEAIAAYENGLSVANKAFDGEHKDVAYINARVGIAYYRHGQYEKATSPLQSALRIRARLVSDSDFFASRLHELLGLVHVGLGDQKSALSEFRESYALRESLAGANDERTRRAKAEIEKLCAEGNYRPACAFGD